MTMSSSMSSGKKMPPNPEKIIPENASYKNALIKIASLKRIIARVPGASRDRPGSVQERAGRVPKTSLGADQECIPLSALANLLGSICLRPAHANLHRLADLVAALPGADLITVVRLRTSDVERAETVGNAALKVGVKRLPHVQRIFEHLMP